MWQCTRNQITSAFDYSSLFHSGWTSALECVCMASLRHTLPFYVIRYQIWRKRRLHNECRTECWMKWNVFGFSISADSCWTHKNNWENEKREEEPVVERDLYHSFDCVRRTLPSHQFPFAVRRPCACARTAATSHRRRGRSLDNAAAAFSRYAKVITADVVPACSW